MSKKATLLLVFLLLILAGAAALLWRPGSPAGPADSAGQESSPLANQSAPAHASAAGNPSPAVASSQEPSTPDSSAPTSQATPQVTNPARIPQGEWATRIPAIEEYAAALPAAHQPALAAFLRQFPDLNPTEHQQFAEAQVRQRATYGTAPLTESQGEDFTAWLVPMEAMQSALVAARARLIGVAVTGTEPLGTDGTTRGFTLVGFEGLKPVYSLTQNAAAAESTGVNLVRMIAAYDSALGDTVNGTGLYVNVNDHGTIFDENPEFQLPSSGGTRIVYKELNDTGDRSHMTHVAGTVGAWGYTANLMGMAPRVWIRSHIQQNTSDITGQGMAWPGQKNSTTNPRNSETEMKSVMGTTSLGYDYTNNLVYSSIAALYDTTFRDYPYYIHFYAASNNGGTYGTLGADLPMAKNLVTVGSVSDTVRDDAGNYVSGGTVSSFSSRGPTFDGRIKPDLMGNGEGLTSPNSATGSGSKSGTSMATPNASGSATLLIDYISEKLPGHFFRSSTIKALLINTATDRGNAGPDYQNGWGLINIKAAADIVKRQAETPASRVVLEDSLASSQTWTRTYTSDGSTPIRVTLAWLDPAGGAQVSTTTDRTPRLVNNLNLRVIQGGTTYQPFVMPFVTGNATLSAFNTGLYGALATTGDNTTDNVEQVLIAAPPAGTYTLQVTHSGSLQGSAAQPFSLALSGLTSNSPLAPVVSSVSPTTGDASNGYVLTVNGSDFGLGYDVLLRRAGSSDVAAYGEQILSSQIICRVDTATLAKGYWDIVVRAPNGTEATLPNAFLLPLSGGGGARANIYTNTFESGSTGLTLGTGWSVADPNKGTVSGPADAQQGSSALVTYAGAEYPGNITTYATLPVFSTVGYTSVQLEIQRWLGVKKQGSSTDTARVQYSLNGTSWTDITAHTNLIESRWGAQTYTLPAAAEGKSAVYLRFSLETDASNHSFGWAIDDLKITGASSATVPPVFSSTAPTSATVSQAFSYVVTVTDSDTAGGSLTFAATGLPPGLSLTNNGDKSATLSGTPTTSGSYAVSISVTDGGYTTYQNFTLPVYPVGGNTAPVITTSSLTDAFVGAAYSGTLTATDANGHPVTFTIGTKPAWLTITNNGNSTATLSGTPPAGSNGTFDLTFSASDGFDTVQKTLALVVRPRATIGFSAATALVSEGGGSVTLTVTRADGNFGAISVSYASANGSASAGSDYTATSGTLSWADGDMSSRSIVVPITQDALSEIDETFTVTLSSLTGIASLGTNPITVTIDDDENNALVSVSATDADCAEASSNDGTFTLTRTGSTTAAMTVNYSLSGTATNGTDYASLTGTATIAAGSATTTVLINPTDDSIYEGDETVILTIDPGIGYNPGDPASAEITIGENDKPTVSVSASATTVEEDVGTVTLTFARTGNTEVGSLAIPFTLGGTAAAGADYTAFPATVTIPIFEESATVTVPILNDSLIEPAETLTVTVTTNSAYNNPSPNNPALTVTLRDDAEPVVLVLSASDNNASEPAKGDGNGTFLVTRWGNVNTALTANFLAPTGTATSGADYTALPTSVSLPAGATTASVTLTPLDDSTAEIDENVILSLVPGTGYTVGNAASGTVNLYDDEAAQVRIEVGDNKALEASTADNGTFIFRRLGNRAAALTVNYTVAGTATNGTDYTTITSPITIGANAGSATLTITPTNDSTVEGPETVSVTVTSGTGYTVAASPDNTATLDIRDDETVDVTVSVQDPVCAEGASPDAGYFRLTRSAASASPLTVNYTLSGTATNGTDFTTLSGSATILANATTLDIPVTPTNDALVEGAESVILTLSFNGTAYDQGDARSVTLWIRDDETPTVTLTAPDASAAEPEDGTTDNGQWTFTASSAPASNLTLNYTISGGTNGTDYTFLPGTITLPAGQTSVTLDLVPLDDELNEGAETVGLTLLNSTTYSSGNTAAVNVIIAASDIPTVRVYSAIPDASENPAVTGQFRFEADKIFTGNTNILYFMSGTATNGTDYTSLTGSIQINGGTNTASLTLTPTNDSDSEGAETALLTITDAAAYSVASGGRTATVTLTDDEADGSRNLLVTPLALTVAESATATFTVALDTAPASDLTVTITRASGDTDLSVQSGASLTFTPANWATPQTVTLAAAADGDALAGTATFSVAATGRPTVFVAATEADAQALPVITLVSPEMSPLAVPDLGVSLELIAQATDTVSTPTIDWSQVSGPAGQAAVFANAASGSTSVSFPASGTYVLRATATDASAQTSTVDLTVFAGSSGAAYTPTTLGATNYAGSASVGFGTLTVTGTGGDITGASESGYYLTTPLSGNFTLTARLASLSAVETGYTLNAAAKAGLVVRESTVAGSRMAFEGMSSDNNSRFIYRGTPNNNLSASNTGSLSIPHWVRLVRNGNTLQAFRSTDNVTWTQQGSNQTITMTNPVQVGFAVASGNLNASQPVAVFDNISGLPAANGAPQINPGPAPETTVGVAASLAGSVTDDALPAGNELSSAWTVVSAPAGGTVDFANANAPTTTATFSAVGTYILRLTATDGPSTVFEQLTVTATSSNTAPTIGTVAAQTIPANGSTGPLAFTIDDAQTAAASLTVNATSSNTTLVPNGNLTLGGSGANRTITVTPAANQTGSTTITLTVSDGTLTANSTFTVTVTETMASWISTQSSVGSLTAATDDPDGDGLANLLEYALGTEPGNATSASLPILQVSGLSPQPSFLTLTFTPQRVTGLTYTLQASNDLVTWSDTVLSGLTPGSPYTHTDSIANPTRRFLRLKITQ